MIELASLVAGGQALKDMYAAFKKVQEVKQSSELCDMLERLSDLRHTLLDAKHEIVELRTEIDELKKRKDIDEQLVFDSRLGVYFMRNDVQRLAYCTKCWTVNQRLVPMTNSNLVHKCAACEALYPKPEPPGPTISRDDPFEDI